MQRTPVIAPVTVLLLCACLLVAGCSSPDSTPQTGPGDMPVTTTAAGALYAPGDIVRNPAGSPDIAWLVIGYDPAQDRYERALIHPNPDSSWGYRTDTRTDTISRSVMEKVYTENVATVLPSSVPVVTPTAATTEPTPLTTRTAAATATTEAPRGPVVSRIIPDKGYAGTTVSISDLVGNNFAYGANVTLSRSGSATIRATDVRVLSNKSMICKFAIPADATAGSWDVTVTNLDGRSSTFTNIFSVNRDPTVITTTAAASLGAVQITGIDPPVAHVGNYQVIITCSGTGTKFQSGAKAKLQKSGTSDITARDTIWTSGTTVTAYFTIPVGSFGNWDLVVTNPDQSYGKWLDVPIS